MLILCPIKVKNYEICILYNEWGLHNYRNTKLTLLYLFGKFSYRNDLYNNTFCENSFGTFTVWKYMYFDAWIVLSWDTDWIQWICMCTYINCYMYCSTMKILIRQIIDPVMLYTLGYMCQNENIDASAINTGKWKGTKLRAASQKSSKMVNKIPSNTINQQSEEWKFLLFFFFQNLQIYIMV